MSAQNISGDVAGAQIVEFGRSAEMGAYDRLPLSVRCILGQAPVKISAVMAERYLTDNGTAALVRLLRARFA